MATPPPRAGSTERDFYANPTGLNPKHSFSLIDCPSVPKNLPFSDICP